MIIKSSTITPISTAEWLTLAREVSHRASWQVSEHNADRLFAVADMFRGLANRQSKTTPRPSKDEIRVWRSWEGK